MTTPPPTVSTIPALLAAARRDSPDRPAVEGRAGTLTYAELDEHVARTAGTLFRLGVRAGDRVAATLPNDLDIIVCFHATVRLGAIWVGINAALATAEKTVLLQRSTPTVYLCNPSTADFVAQAVAALPGGPTLVRVSGGGGRAWSSDLGHVEPVTDGGSVGPHTPAAIAYTSGTSGVPKGVTLSHGNLLLPALSLAATRGYGPTLRKADCLPMTIVSLLVLSTLLTTAARGCTVAMDRRDLDGIVEWLRASSPTAWNGVPAMFHDMLARPDLDTDDLRSLAEVWTGGTACPPALRAAFHDRFGIWISKTYGLTEAPTIIAIDDAGAPGRPDSSGRPLPQFDLAARSDDGRRLPAGDIGEICVRAATTGAWAYRYRPMLGYWPVPAGESSASDGWLHTGDIGFVDTDDTLHILERKQNLIIRGGANVYPAEVEAVVSALPNVHACVAFGVPDDRLGERVAIVVEQSAATPANPDAIHSACRSALARYKVPEQVHFVAELPRNPMGKIERAKATAQFLDAPAPR